jgi:nitrate reductase NapE component
LICSPIEEAFVTLAMMHVDGARTRMPMACTVISTLVLALVGALGFISWILETNHSSPDVQGARSVNAVQSSVPAANAPDAADSPETEPWIRYGREF